MQNKITNNKSEKKYILLLFAVSMFFTGMSGIINEYILAKLSTDILGNSAIQWGIVIGVMLLMMGIGGSIQLLIKNNQLITGFVTIEILLAILGSSAPIVVLWAFGYTSHNFLLFLYFYIIFIGLLVGAEIPLLIRLSKLYLKETTHVISLIFSMDYIGSFIGTLVWLFFIIKIKLPLYKMSYVVASFNFIAALITFLYLTKTERNKNNGKIIIFIITSFMIIYSFINSDKWENLIYQKLFKDPIIYKIDTPYQSIVLTRNSTTKKHYLYINGNTQLYEGDEKIYHESLVIPALSLWNRSRVLILGGGDGCALREVLKFKDVKEVTLVDLDPEMIKFAKNNPIMKKINNNSFKDSRVQTLKADFINYTDKQKDIYKEKGYNFETKLYEYEKIAKVNVFNVDAKKFLENVNKFYDVVIIDFPDPNNIELTKLYSLEFFINVKRKLSKNGVFVMQSTSPTYSKKAFWTIKKTMEAAGFNTVPYHIDVPSFGDWGFIMGSQRKINKDYLISRFKNLKNWEVKTKEIDPATFISSLNFRKGLLDDNKNYIINTLANPVLLDFYLLDGWKDY
ncbi:spermidine synthase [Hypnocyclicus thermotrophus]|uniref:Polyamine aminopropyltransferase n=1 Tax=Hypnocyclicus thermotrophus TaxID=1627895 RepID=A0AA46E019_9FUSO|nr:polyamine aminopropyltransferase [Hypnocyclicus thermotrophus]TDT72305.1 spermidine synthase [Hypnocyclicus thermotrophus]